MEYERTIFRVHQKIMVGERCLGLLMFTSIILIAFGIVNFFILLAGHIMFKNGTGVVSAAIRQYHDIQLNKNDVLPTMFKYPGALSFENFSSKYDVANTTSPLTSGSNPGSSSKIPNRNLDIQSPIKNGVLKDNKLNGGQNKEEQNKKADPTTTFNTTEIEKFAKDFSMTAKELEEAIKKSPDFINMERKKKGLYPVMQLLQHRAHIFMDLDVIVIHLVKNFSPVLGKNMALIPYSNINNNTQFLQSYAISNNQESLRLFGQGKRELVVNHTIFIDVQKLADAIPSIFNMLSLDSLVLMDIISYFNSSNIAVNNRKTGENWFWTREEFQTLRGFMSTGFYLKVYQLIYVVAALVVLSFATSLYTKIVTLLSPLILYAIIHILRGRRFLRTQAQYDGFMQNYYRAFSWVGIYLKTIRQSALSKFFENHLIIGMTLVIVMLYYVYVALAKITDRILFSKTYPANLNDDFFGTMASVELIGIFFFRSRETLALLPRSLLVTCTCFFMYVTLTAYGYYELGFRTMWCFIAGQICYCLAVFEIPAMELNDADFNKPTLSRPRSMVQPFFSLTWYHDLPPLWTIFIPMFDRSYFSNREMSLVDQNFPLLNQYLRGRPQNPQNQENENNNIANEEEQGLMDVDEVGDDEIIVDRPNLVLPEYEQQEDLQDQTQNMLLDQSI